MSYPPATYSKIFPIEKEKQVIVKAKLAYQGLESFGFAVSYVVLPFIVVYVVSSLLSNFVQLGPETRLAINFIVFFLALFLAIKGLSFYLAQPVLTIDTAKATISEHGLDKFEAALADLKGAAVVEEKYGENKLYRVEYILADGKKTSGFAFTSFNKAEEVVTIIKEVLEK